MGYLKQKSLQVLANCTKTALDSLKRKLFSLISEIWRLTFVCRKRDGREFYFREMGWKKDLEGDETDGTFRKRIIWFEQSFNRKFAVGNYILPIINFFSFVDILAKVGQWLQFNTLPNADYTFVYS